MRPLLPLLLASTFLLALLASPLSTAGTKAAPEVNDPAKDVTYSGAAAGQGPALDDPSTVGPTTAQQVDMLQAWVDGETAKAISFHLRVTGGFDKCNAPVAPVTWTFTAQANGKTVTQAFVFQQTGTTSCSAFAASAPVVAQNVTLSDTSHVQLDFVIPRSLLGSPNTTAPLVFKWASQGYVYSSSTSAVLAVTDAAPNGGGFSTTPYVFTMDTAMPAGSGGGGTSCTFKANETDKADSDKDCLPDYWEKKYFTNVTAQNGTGDPDGDGCNNRCEYLAGTDPTVAQTPCVFKEGETNKTDADGDCLPDYWEQKYFNGTSAQNATGDPDGDGCDNRCEYLAGTDPTVANANGTGTGTGSRTQTGTGSTTTTRGAGSSDLSAIEKLQQDAGYVVASGAAMGAVVLISLVGLFGRWAA